MMDETLQLDDFADEFEAAREALREGRPQDALEELLHVRERGLIDRHLDQCIDVLRDGDSGDGMDPVVDWLERMLDRIHADENSIFQTIEEITSSSEALNESDLMPLSEASSVGLELRGVDEGESAFPAGDFDKSGGEVTAQFDDLSGDSEDSDFGGQGDGEEPTQLLDAPGGGFALVDDEDDEGGAGGESSADRGGQDSDAETAIPDSEPDEEWANEVLNGEGDGPPSAPTEAPASTDLLDDLDAALDAADREHEDVRRQQDDAETETQPKEAGGEEPAADFVDDFPDIHEGESEALELGESDVVFEAEEEDDDGDLGFELGLENPGAEDPAGVELGGADSVPGEGAESGKTEDAPADDSGDFFSGDYDSGESLFGDDFDFDDELGGGDDGGDDATPVFSGRDATPMIPSGESGEPDEPDESAEEAAEEVLAESSASFLEPDQPSVDELFEGGFESELPAEDDEQPRQADEPEEDDEAGVDPSDGNPDEQPAAADLFGGESDDGMGMDFFGEEDEEAQPAADLFGEALEKSDDEGEEDVSGEDPGDESGDEEGLSFEFGESEQQTRVANSEEFADQLAQGHKDESAEDTGAAERDEADEDEQAETGQSFRQTEESTRVADSRDLASRLAGQEPDEGGEHEEPAEAKDAGQEGEAEDALGDLFGAGDDGDGDDMGDEHGLGLGFEESSEPTRVASSEELEAGLEASSVSEDTASTEEGEDGKEREDGEEDEEPNPFRDDRRTAAVDPLDDNEFFKLVDSIAEEESSDDEETNVYRGEPLVDSSVDALDELSESAPEVPRAPEENSESSTFVPVEEAEESASGTGQSAGAQEKQPSDLSSPTESSKELNSGAVRLLSEAERLFEEGHIDSSHDLVQSVLDSNPDSARANELLEEINRQREPKLLETLGGPRAVPAREIPMAKLAGGDFDHRFGFILSLVDGQMCVDDILELSSMSRTETLSVLAKMLDRSIISIS